MKKKEPSKNPNFVDNIEYGGEVVDILFDEHDVKTHTFFWG